MRNRTKTAAGQRWIELAKRLAKTTETGKRVVSLRGSAGKRKERKQAIAAHAATVRAAWNAMLLGAQQQGEAGTSTAGGGVDKKATAARLAINGSTRVSFRLHKPRRVAAWKRITNAPTYAFVIREASKRDIERERAVAFVAAWYAQNRAVCIEQNRINAELLASASAETVYHADGSVRYWDDLPGTPMNSIERRVAARAARLGFRLSPDAVRDAAGEVALLMLGRPFTCRIAPKGVVDENGRRVRYMVPVTLPGAIVATVSRVCETFGRGLATSGIAYGSASVTGWNEETQQSVYTDGDTQRIVGIERRECTVATMPNADEVASVAKYFATTGRHASLSALNGLLAWIEDENAPALTSTQRHTLLTFLSRERARLDHAGDAPLTDLLDGSHVERPVVTGTTRRKVGKRTRLDRDATAKRFYTESLAPNGSAASVLEWLRGERETRPTGMDSGVSRK